MQDLGGKVAVVTGAASGIGLALAERFVDEGMRVVASDVEQGALERAVSRLRERGGEIEPLVADVSRAEAVERIAERCWDTFGACHVLCNNAGVLSGGLSWEIPVVEWDWVLGVNLYGVVHGIRSFLPRMRAQESAGGGSAHVVNVASMAGLTTVPFASVYHVSKHGVVALSECLYKELAATGSTIGVSVLCPEMIATRIGEADRNRPAGIEDGPADSAREMVMKSTREAAQRGLPPAVMADRVVAAIRDRRFYVVSEGDPWRRLADTRCEDVRNGRNPTLALPEA